MTMTNAIDSSRYDANVDEIARFFLPSELSSITLIVKLRVTELRNEL